jgi:two-component system, LuxR family, sensor kinase FixL
MNAHLTLSPPAAIEDNTPPPLHQYSPSFSLLGEEDFLSTPQERIQRLEQRVEHLTSALTSALEEVGKAALELEEKDRMLVRATDVEQQRLGQDLHDSVGQILTGIGLVSRGLEANLSAQGLPEAEAAANIKELALQALDQVRSIARGRSSHHVDRYGLAHSLEDLCQRVSRLHGIRCSFCLEGTINVGLEASISLFHISQEAISNSLKHGRANQIHVALAHAPAGVELAISDNGKWVERSRDSDGVGLAIMRSRARALGGFLDIVIGVSGEVEVRCTVPIRKMV